jgi:hypothetical protein
MPDIQERKLRDLSFLCATTITAGFTDDAFYEFHRELARYNDAHKETTGSVEYRTFRSPFVEAARDDACKHMMEQNYDGLLFVDADMVGYPSHAMAALIEDAFIKVPASDVVGAYCNLKSDPFLPTIDTGTGTWEPHMPGAGILEVIRTGGAFLFVKATAIHKLGPPPLTWITSLDASCQVGTRSTIHPSGLVCRWQLEKAGQASRV